MAHPRVDKNGSTGQPLTAPDSTLPWAAHAVEPSPVAPGRAPPRSLLSVAWAGIWTAALVSIALIVFMLQNTRSVRVSYLGLHGTLPLALALLIAMVGGIVLTLVFGTARITQLRRRARRYGHADRPATPTRRRSGTRRP